MRATSLIVVAMLAPACASAPRSGGSNTELTNTLTAAMHASAEAWNRGDLEGFLAVYHDAPETAFLGANVALGLDNIRQRYISSYWREGRPKDRLVFEELHVQQLSDDHALMRGRYVLSDPTSGTRTSTGLFTLIWARTAPGWRIIHDHSSAS